MDISSPFILIDDDKMVVDSLKALINKIFPNSSVHEAYDGIEGWDLISKIRLPTIVLCDIFMPGLNGLQLLKKVKSERPEPETYFIILTSGTDKEHNLKALQLGANDILYKPFSIDELIGRLRTGSSIINYVHQLKEGNAREANLQQSIDNFLDATVNLMVKIQESRNQETGKLLNKFTAQAVWVAQELGDLDERAVKNIENAAMLVFAPKIFLPDKNFIEPVMKKGLVSNQVMEKFPDYVTDLLGKFKGFESVTEILLHLYENYDGSGMPGKIQGWKIPVGSRIIRICLDFEDYMKTSGNSLAQAYEQLELESKRLYDFKLVALFDQYFAVNGDGKSKINEVPMLRTEIAPGMTLSRNLFVESEQKIMAANTQLDEEKIAKIISISNEDPIIGKIYIKNIIK